ncbi:MAG TPA: energy-coupling factor transporter transmembrane protein EcfT [Clostridia bacterium]|nr:energy-coupling factor transporter transmembrane protein EcfT [Clostridia bacterium]
MDMFLYMDKDSLLHRLDPRTKIFIMLISFAIALMFSSLSILLVLSAVIILYGYTGKVLANLKRIQVILIMIALMSVILWAFTYPGTTRIWGPITKEGIIYGIAIGIKFDIMIISGMIFLSSTKIEEISLGLMKLGIPYRPAFAFSTAVRLVPMIVATSYTITQAQKSRGLDLDTGNLIQRIKKYIPLLIPVLISIIRQANILAMALESKGFGYSDKRTNYLEIKFTASDYVFITIAFLILLFAIYFKIKYKM